MATETPAVLDIQKIAHPSLAPIYDRIQAAASNKCSSLPVQLWLILIPGAFPLQG